MATRHTVQQGDCLVSIAEQYGFFWETLWNHAENRALRDRRSDPTVLLPGDVVFVPDREIKSHVRPTGARHTFRAKNVPAKLNLRLLDEGGDPRAGLAYVLNVDGVETRGSTDGDGYVKASIPPMARRGTLTLTASGEEYDLDLGHLDPVDTILGAQARLAQMGAWSGSVDGSDTPAWRAALSAFQDAQGVAVTGELDEDTQTSLRNSYKG